MTRKKSILIRNTGLTVIDILNYLCGGFTMHEIIKTHPSLTRHDIKEALIIARDIVLNSVILDYIYLNRLNPQKTNNDKFKILTDRHWSPKDLKELSRLHQSDIPADTIARLLLRQPENIQNIIDNIKKKL